MPEVSITPLAADVEFIILRRYVGFVKDIRKECGLDVLLADGTVPKVSVNPDVRARDNPLCVQVFVKAYGAILLLHALYKNDCSILTSA
jgi:hypothetical protein